jgi:hypothetical protein
MNKTAARSKVSSFDGSANSWTASHAQGTSIDVAPDAGGEDDCMQARRLTCHFEPPEHGWLRVRIESLPNAVSLSASHRPLDSVSELATVLLRVLRFRGNGEVSWNEEPDTMLTAFQRRGDRLRLRVDIVARGQRTTLLEHDGTARSVVAAFLSGLKQLDAECAHGEFEAGWRHPFPRDAVAQLERLLDAEAK